MSRSARVTHPGQQSLTTLSAFDAFAGGVGFIVTTPRVWLYALVPAVVMGLLTIVFTVLAVLGSTKLSAWIFGAERGSGVRSGRDRRRAFPPSSRIASAR